MKTRFLLFLLLTVLLAACSSATATPQPTATSISSDDLPVMTDPVQARNLAIVFLYTRRSVTEEALDPTAWEWSEENVTPKDLVGATTMQYTSGDWIVQVAYPLTAPEEMSFHVTVNNIVLGLHWQGDISAQRKITETVFIQEK